MGLVEQQGAKVGGVVHAAAIALGNVQKEVERAIGLGADGKGPALNDLHGKIAPPHKGLAHFVHAFHAAGQGRKARLLRDGADI